MKFRNQEQFGLPDGVSVIATSRALEKAGAQPVIDHGNLQQLMEEELRLPGYGIKLYDGSQLGSAPAPLDVWHYGYPTLWNKTLHVPVTNMASANPMTRLIAAGLSAQAKQERKFPPRYWGTEIAVPSTGALAVGLATNTEAAALAGFAGLSLTGIFKGLGDHQSPLVRFSSEIQELRQDHERDITFPGHRDVHYLSPAQ